MPTQKLAGFQAGWHYTSGLKSQNVMAVSLLTSPEPALHSRRQSENGRMSEAQQRI
jgi:hypothetical protein